MVIARPQPSDDNPLLESHPLVRLSLRVGVYHLSVGLDPLAVPLRYFSCGSSSPLPLLMAIPYGFLSSTRQPFNTLVGSCRHSRCSSARPLVALVMISLGTFVTPSTVGVLYFLWRSALWSSSPLSRHAHSALFGVLAGLATVFHGLPHVRCSFDVHSWSPSCLHPFCFVHLVFSFYIWSSSVLNVSCAVSIFTISSMSRSSKLSLIHSWLVSP